MFGKLLKHEWKATAPSLGILNLAILVTSVVAALLLNFDGIRMDGPFAIVLAMVMVFALIAAVICAFAAEVILLVRFYKSRFTDQGYLTFTLPVNSHQVFLSSALNMLIWTIITAVVAIGSYILFAVIGAGRIIEDFYEEFRDILGLADPLSSFISPNRYAYSRSLIAQIMIAVPYAIVTAQTCITVGAVVAKKHKILAFFGAYYALSFVVSTVSTVLTKALSITTVDMLIYSSLEQTYEAMTKQILWINIPMYLILTVGCYFLSTWLMKRKLNLP